MRRLVPSNEHIVEQIRVHVAFERMIASVLSGAFLGAGLVFVIKLAGLVFSPGEFFASLPGLFVDGLFVGFMIFLIGFFASVAVGAPLFMALEKHKRRAMQPYLAAALAVALACFLIIAFRRAPELTDFAGTFIPAIVIARSFARRMQPYWRAAAREEAASANIVRLH